VFARGCDQITLAVQFQQIDGGRVELAALPSADFEQIVVGKAETETHEESKDAVKDFLDAGRFAENRDRGVHTFIVGDRYVFGTKRRDAEFMQ
jgi:hypothetical protein